MKVLFKKKKPESHIIRLRGWDAAEGFKLLAFSGLQTMRLRNNEYVVGKAHLKLLKKEGIGYDFISKATGLEKGEMI